MRFCTTLLVLCMFVCILVGCSSASAPVEPPTLPVHYRQSESNRYLWGYWDISIDPDTLAYSLIPRRDISFHLNARKFLEDGPCYYCLSILGVQFTGDGKLLVDIELKHPFLGLNVYTGFDVRGIAIFPGSREWPSNGLFTSEGEYGEGEVLNADGYTTLFNPVDFPPGSGSMPMLEYSHGKFASADPSTTLNAYKVFYSSENRRYFATGGAIAAQYEIKKPIGPIHFGYAVDACWMFPKGGGPVDVPDDFPISANCIEAYQISAVQKTELEQGGHCVIEVDVYDWQGTDTIAGVHLEAPELYNGFASANMVEDYGTWARFQATVFEEKSVAEGDYDCLIRVDDNYSDPNLGEVAAYNMVRLTVVEGGGNPDCDGNLFLIADGNTFTGTMGEDNAQMMANMILFDAGPGEFADADVVKFYNGHSGKFNSTLTAMQTVVNDLGFTFEESDETPIKTTDCRMIVIYEPGFFNASDFFFPGESQRLVYFLHNGGRLLLVSDYTNGYYNDKAVLDDLLIQMGSTIVDDSYTNIPGIWITDLADCPVMEGVTGISMAANTRFILGSEDMCLGYSEQGGGVMFCSTKHYN